MPEKLLHADGIGKAEPDAEGDYGDGKEAGENESDRAEDAVNVARERPILIVTAIVPGPVVSGRVSG